MRALLVLYIFFFLFVPLSAQIVDDFSDGNLTSNPIWQGSVSDFIVNEAGQLQLSAATSGESILYTTINIEKAVEWRVFFNMDFNPSSGNALRIYLQADDTNFLNSSGYFLEVGETGSMDAVKFYRQDNGMEKLLVSASMGAVAEKPNVMIRITRSAEGVWQIFADYEGGDNLKLEGTVKDITYLESGSYAFGFYCKYTTTRLDQFYFDNVCVKTLLRDTKAPVLVDLKTVDEATIELTFNESLKRETAINITHYSLDKEIGNPSLIDLITPNQVHLRLAQAMVNNENYRLSIHNISDLNENILNNYDTIFQYTKIEVAEQYDILINEIMEDPTLSGGGTLGLPAEEYVELYNRSNKTINLEGFVFTDGSARPAVFPFYLMAPNTYLIIGKTSATALENFGEFLSLTDFPTLSAKETLVLKNEFGDPIDVINYTQEWYGTTANTGGSYALERINPQNPCAGITNWQSSTSFLGGSPGKENTALNLFTAALPLNLIDAYPLSSTQVKLTFDKFINAEDLTEIAKISITNNKVTSISSMENNFKEVIINIESPLRINQVETVSVATSFRDCIGQPINGQLSRPIALPALSSANDLVINELLFNPETGGVDFVEILNRSEKVIDLNGLFLANQALDNPQIKPINLQKLIFPNNYFVFTENPTDIKNRYTVENPNNLVVQDLPTFEDKAGQVLLYTNEGATTIFLDEFNYTADFHNPLLNDKNGVSLERINSNLPTQDSGNWQSASEVAGYATPTYKNSQQIELVEERTNIFSVSNNRISPDGDGFEDVLQINYLTDQAGYTATIHMYDATGRLIDKIAQNRLLSTSGSFKWEGVTSEGQKVKMGIYILWIEYVNLTGEVGQSKEAIIVANKF